MATTGQNFSNVARHQRMFAAACSLAAGAGPAKAARAARCSRATVYNWLARPDFQELCQRACETHNQSLLDKQCEINSALVDQIIDLPREHKRLSSKIRALQAAMTLAGWRMPDE